MATLLVDSQPAQASERSPADAPAGAPAELVSPGPGTPAGLIPPAAPADQTCARCGAAMALSQDWCLQCGASAPGSLGSPGWRSAATIMIATALLALGAAAAGYAALSKKTHKPATVTTTVAQAPPPAVTTTPTPITPGTPTTIKPLLPSTTAVKPPKIPLSTTPAVTPTVPTIPTATTPTTPSTTGGAGATTEQAAILLDTNAASTYNPYNYAATDFGDPSLAIDGDTSTGWTAQVEPTTAPKMAEGVLIDLKVRKKLAAVKLITSSPGMTVQLYGANGKTAPPSITDPAWVPLSRSQVARKKHIRIKLRNSKKAFTFVTLWISQAPAAAIGTPEAPGHVSVNELELFPAG